MKKIIQILFLSFCLLGTMLAQAQTVNVSGKITDSSGETLPGVTIIIKGTSNGTVTNIDGDYTISSVPSDGVLIFSFVGMLMQEIEVANQTTINVTMAMDAIGIEEVIAVGYGTMKKSDLTGSVVSVKSEELLERPSSNLGQALQGKASGVQVRTASAAPGGGVSIIIRGNNSVNSGSQPLYIVDGVPLTDINTIPVEDMESVEVLKDASSTAIYGSRGANGVILITTKKGKTNTAPQISYSTRFSWETIAGNLDIMNGEEYATFYNEWELFTGRTNDPSDVSYNGSAFDRPTPAQAGEGTNWLDAITQTGMVQNHTLSLNGGNEKTTYAMSVSYLSHKGMVISGKYDRFNIKSSVNSKVTNWLDTGMDIFLSHNTTHSSGENTGLDSGGLIRNAAFVSPVQPVYDEEGNYAWNTNPTSQTLENPVAQAKEVDDYNRVNRGFGNIYLNFKPLKDLSVKVSAGGDIKNNKSYYYNPTTTYSGNLNNGNARVGVNDNAYFINENIATYKKQFGMHKLDVVAGFTYEQNIYESVAASGTDFFTDAYLYNNLAAASTYGTPQSSKTKWSLASGLGRINYVFKDKYLLTFTGRYDGSSKFGEGNKWGFFPSVAGAWRISEEEFLQDVDWLTYGKIRASWGETGNQNIGLYQSLAKFGLANYPIGNQIVSGVAATSLENSDLKWETTQSLDIGIDVGLFNKVTLTFDYYKKKTMDLLLGVALIETSGFSSATMNTGEIQNEGWDFSVDAKIIDSQVKWNAMASIFKNTNQITKLTDPTQDWKIGHSTGSDRGYVVDGVIRDQAALDAYSDPDGVPISGAQIGDYRRVDTNGDYKITGDDQVIIFDPEPDFSFSLNNEVSWKDFTLSVFLYGNVGGQIRNDTKGYLIDVLNVRNNMSSELLSIENGEISRNFWTEENPDAKYAKLGATSAAYMKVEDGAFVKIQDLRLSYEIPAQNWFSNASIYCSVQNLYTFTKYTGWDPDVSSFNSNVNYGIDSASYPNPRTFTMGLNITF